MRSARLLVVFTIAIHFGAQGVAQTPPIVPEKVIALFNGRDLSGWFADVPDKDKSPNAPARLTFIRSS